MLNKAMVIGRLGDDPSMRYTANGNAVTTFNVATSRSFAGQDGQKREETEWFSVVTWNRLAETCAQYLVKGRLVYVEGRMQTRSWDDKTSGQKRYKTELIAEEVKFLGDNRSANEAGPVVSASDEDGDIDPENLPF